MDISGCGWAIDNAFVERFWCTVKNKVVYLRDDDTAAELQEGLNASSFTSCNRKRRDQTLRYRIPAELHFGERQPALCGLLKFGSNWS